MTRKQRLIQLTQDEFDFLTTYVAYGQKNARQINRARTLLLSHDGKAAHEIVKVLGISRATVYNVRKKYPQQKYDHIVDILQDQPRQGRPIRFDHKVEAHVSMIACSEAPIGTSRWTLQLIADKLVQLNVVDSISHESVRGLLKKQA